LIDGKFQVIVRMNGHTNGVLVFEREDYELFMAMMGLLKGRREFTGGHEVVVCTEDRVSNGRGPAGLGQVR
jgi:hypothetical protein